MLAFNSPVSTTKGSVMFRSSKRLALAGSAAIVIVAAVAAAAFAIGASELEPRATAWAETTCNAKLLTVKESAAVGQKIATCYAVAQSKADKATINGLQEKVSNLEANQTPAPVNVTFFSNTTVVNESTGVSAESSVTSPVFDASGFKQFAASSAQYCLGPVFVETSNDDAVWIKSTKLAEGNVVVPVTSRYIRIYAPGSCLAATGTITALAHFSS